MPGSRALRRWLVGVVVLLLTASSCSARSDAPQQLDGWRQVALPDRMVPSTLAVGADTLLVGGYRRSGTDRAPALASLPLADTDAALAPVPLTPRTPYGKVADLVSVTGSGNSIVALGAARGGAHANARWTIWSGTPDRVTDRPQTFETFGGWEAGTLLGVATDRHGPLVAGTWQGAYGPDGAVWRADGERWVRQPTVPALASTTGRQVSPRTMSQQGDGSVVLNGSVIDLADGVQQSAAVWHDDDGSWTPTVLGGPGGRSEAWSTACDSGCWSVGARDGSLAVWAGDHRETAPSLVTNDTDAGRVVLWRDRRVISASSNGAGHLLIGHDDDWEVYSAPTGPVGAASLAGTTLYVVGGSEESRSLWVRDLADVLSE